MVNKRTKKQMFDTKQRFSIRKYHFGAASVLLGLSFLTGAQTASAQEVTLAPETVETEAPISESVTEEPVTEAPVATEPTAVVEETTAAPVKETVTETTVAAEETTVAETTVAVEETTAATTIVAETSVAETTIAETTTQADLSDAKIVLEQVASEAAVLASEGYRTAATNPALTTLADQAKAAGLAGEALFNDSAVTLSQVQAQIATIRTAVEALAVELSKQSPDGAIEIALAATTGAAAPGTETGGEDAIVYTGSEHFKNYDAADITKIKKQITWLDFSAGNWSGLDNVNGNPALAVGATYKKEIAPGYVVEVTVSELKPFESTEYYYERVKGTDHEWTYNPDAVNSNKNIYEHGKTDYGNEARIIAAPQNQWSAAKNQELDIPGLVTLRSIKDGGNVGVKFTTKATYLGNEVPLNVVFMSGEEAGNSEVEIYTTNGDAFELFGELSNDQTTSSYKALGVTSSATDYGFLGYNDLQGTPAWKEFFDAKYWANIATPESEATAIQTAVSTRDNGLKVVDGIGTKLFGPVSNHLDETYNYSTPIIMTKNASEVGMYIMASGRQSSMIGVVLLDYGDAPASYGTGAHSINFNEADKQPYLGTKPADIDFIPEGIPVGAADWYRDELINQFDEGLVN